MPYFNYKSKQIYYSDSNEGIPILFLHAFGLDSSAYHDFFNSFGTRYRWILPDIPGIGLSDALADYSMVSLANCMDSFRTSLDIEVWTIIGHSIGGYIAMELLHRYPDTLSAMLLLHSHCYADAPDKKEARSKQIDFVQRNDHFIFMKELLGKLFSSEYISTHSAHFDHLIQQTVGFSKAGIIGCLKAMRDRSDLSDVLSRAIIPVGFILSLADQAIPVEASLAQLTLPTRSAVYFPAHSTHMSMFEAPVDCRKALSNFLNVNNQVYL